MHAMTRLAMTIQWPSNTRRATSCSAICYLRSVCCIDWGTWRRRFMWNSTSVCEVDRDSIREEGHRVEPCPRRNRDDGMELPDVSRSVVPYASACCPE